MERFHDVFPASAGQAQVVTMRENHRSRQRIIDVAEIVVDPAGLQAQRHGVSTMTAETPS